MNILLVFSTNSGSTQTVAQMIADGLSGAGHKVNVQEARMTKPEDFTKPDTILLGSPSWDFEGKEGQPNEDFFPLMAAMKSTPVPKPFAIFGLGDASYRYFNGAVDHLEEFAKSIGGTILIPSLRIDNYYANVDGNNEKITEWTTELTKKLTT